MKYNISNHKIYQLIATMSDVEVRQMKKLLQSNYFTSRIHLKKAFEVLVKVLKKSGKEPDSEWLHYQIFPNQTYNNGQLRKAMSDLFQLVKEGLLIQVNKSKSLQANLALLKLFRDRKQDKAYRSLARQTEELIRQQPKRNSNYFEGLLQYQTEVSKYDVEEKHFSNNFLQSNSDLEDILYISKKLRAACAQLSHQRVHKQEFDFGLLPPLLTEITKEKYLTIPSIALYYYCFKFLSEPQESEYFQKYKITLNENSELFSVEDIADSYRSAINYCIGKNNEGDHSFLPELWELYKNGLDQGILLIDSEIPRFTFDNALTAGLRLKEFDWAKTFILEKSAFLHPDYRKQTVLFNLGKLAYEQKDYETALVHLSSTEFKELRINVVGKIMLMKIFYELASFAALDSHILAFQQFIRRKEVSDYHRKNILNIASYLKRIISLAPYDHREKKQLRRKIQQEEILSEREWLLAKLDA